MIVFWAREIKRFLEDLGLHRLLAQHAFKVTHALLQLTDLGSSHLIFIGVYGSMAPLKHSALPGKELDGAMPARRAT